MVERLGGGVNPAETQGPISFSRRRRCRRSPENSRKSATGVASYSSIFWKTDRPCPAGTYLVPLAVIEHNSKWSLLPP